MTNNSQTTEWSAFPLAQPYGSRRATPEIFPQFVAAYLPFYRGVIDWESFKRVIDGIYDAGCVPVVNADTGWAFLLTSAQKREVVEKVRQWHPDKEILVGVTTGANPGVFDADAYNAAIAEVKLDEKVRIMVMVSEGLLALRDDALIAAYASLEGLGDGAILHELTSEFVPFGREFSPYELEGILQLDPFRALKTSALSGPAIPRRVKMLKMAGLQSQVLVLSGVDWKVREAFEHADGILMGAASLFPKIFTKLAALRRDSDQAPNEGDRWRYEELVCAVQSVVSYQFLPGTVDGIDVGNYRHLTALWLNVLGVIRSHETPPGVQEHHKRNVSEVPLIKSYIKMLREVIRAIGENPDELLPNGHTA